MWRVPCWQLLGCVLRLFCGEQGCDLRSRCLLAATKPFAWELLDKPERHHDPSPSAGLTQSAVRLISRRSEKAACRMDKELVLQPSRVTRGTNPPQQMLAAAVGAENGGKCCSPLDQISLRRAVATHPADREQPEWPPHPDRVFMALAATHLNRRRCSERAALDWLSEQEPQLCMSRPLKRNTVTAFVPVNDVAVPRLSAGRTPSVEQVRPVWAFYQKNDHASPGAFPLRFQTIRCATGVVDCPAAPEQLEALARLCAKVPMSVTPPRSCRCGWKKVHA